MSKQRCQVAHTNTNGAYMCIRDAGHVGPCAAWPASVAGAYGLTPSGDRIAELERTVEDLEARLEAVEALVVP